MNTKRSEVIAGEAEESSEVSQVGTDQQSEVRHVDTKGPEATGLMSEARFKGTPEAPPRGSQGRSEVRIGDESPTVQSPHPAEPGGHSRHLSDSKGVRAAVGQEREGIVEGARSSADGTGSLLNRLHVPGRTKARRADWCLRVPWRCPPACSRWHRAHACPRARAGHATCSQPGLASRQGETAGPPCVGRLGTSPAASVSAWPSRTRGSLSVRWLQVPLPGAQRARR